MTTKIWQVDAFAEKAFEGNPAGVVPLDAEPPEDWMAAVAREMNLSETAFLWPVKEVWRLRWFTPAREVKLCGHATLASAHLLWETKRLAPDRAAEFETLSGRLSVRRREDGRLELDFPARPPVPTAPPAGLAAALGVEPVEVHASEEDLLVRLPDESAVAAVAPDFGALRKVEARGVIVTAPADPGRRLDFVSRFFAPTFGVDEDPVTGSAHCVLAPYWIERLGRSPLVGRQISARGGTLEVRLDGDRVRIAGRAVTVLAGELTPAAAPAPRTA